MSCLQRVAAIACLLGIFVPQSFGAEESPEQFFERSVLPILEKHCFKCHSHQSKMAKGGLVLDSRGGWEKGGDNGPAVEPNAPDRSLLIQAIRYDNSDLQMPPDGRLPGELVAVLERWVATGAADPRVINPSQPRESVDLDEGRKHWAFQPIQDPPPPQVADGDWPRQDLDRFLLAKLEAKGLRPAADADRYTWLRRVSLDLTGLPPTAEQIAAFIADTSPQAEEHVVDRLLASRGYGERWARHWLDLVGYADQIGTANDIFAEHAWRYRDYVIAAMNSDKPFDQFVREQIAGDLLPYGSPEQRAEQMVATGFLLLGDLTIVEADKAKLRIDVVDQQVDKIGRAFLAQTIGCARCHDHKFDPIPQRDYYALAGILNSTESIVRAEWGVWSWPSMVELPESEPQQAERLVQAERHRQRLESMQGERNHLRARKAEVDESLKNMPPPAEGQPADATRTLLTKLQQEIGDRLRRLDVEIQHAEFFAPMPPKAFGVRDTKEPGDMRITIRGNAHALGDQVPRGFLQVALAGSSTSLPSAESGRRELAEWIVSPANPLTARVVANRIWSKLFGEGLVRSVDYFGLPGERPSHPELLDDLASRLIADGWSQRRLIRTVALSRAYRMSASMNSDAAAADPDNRLLWRMNPQRLDAEAVRDSLLLVSGKLIETRGGPALPLEFLENTGNLAKGQVNPPSFALVRFRPEQSFERTVYLPIIRSAPQAGPAALRNVFDFTQPAEFAGKRAVTSVPTQALFLMNSQLMKDRAKDLAERILHTDSNDESRLTRLWLRVLNRPIADPERTDAVAFLASIRNDLGTESAPASDVKVWTELCHSLLASNEFLMRL